VALERRPAFVRFARERQPHIPLTLWSQMMRRYARMENFRSAARAGIDAGGFHLLQRFFDAQFGDSREVVDFDHREGFEMHVRVTFF